MYPCLMLSRQYAEVCFEFARRIQRGQQAGRTKDDCMGNRNVAFNGIWPLRLSHLLQVENKKGALVSW